MRRWLALASLASLTGCGTFMSNLKASMVGGGEVEVPAEANAPAKSRHPSSIVAYDNRTPSGLTSARPDSVGPDLAANEFGALARQNDERAARGFRRQATPWDGTGPASEGSLWNPEGQDNYLFTKNLAFKIGDFIVVKVDPEVNRTLNDKISGLLGRSTIQQIAADEAGAKAQDALDDKLKRMTGSDKLGNALAGAVGQATTAALDAPAAHVDIADITVRIMEELPRNSYRIEGARRIYIRNAPYQIKLSGIVRDEDIGPARLVASSRVFESRMELTK